MATIEERLHSLLANHLDLERWRHRPKFYGVGVEIPNDNAATWFDTACDLEAAIIEIWNAMHAVMKLLLLDYDVTAPSEADNHPGWWGCRYCDGEQWDHPELHTPDKCPVAAAQAALAKMEGLHETADVV